LRTFASIEDGRRIVPGTKIMTPFPAFPRIETTESSDLENSQTSSNAAKEKKANIKETNEKTSSTTVSSGIDVSAYSSDELTEMIASKGAEVRDLKSSKAEKEVVKAAVDQLLALKQR
jgi:uncharacterized small protein (DUF1192 family)